ncbi:MAG: serine hydrolase domain-containing protein [Woeseiaceae bacterium]
MKFQSFLCLFAVTTFACASNADEYAGYKAVTSMDDIQINQRKVPDDDIWWNVRGEQMRWMHLNAHQLFPTVNVYRKGPVRMLDTNLMPAIGQTEVQLDTVTLTFDEFLDSEYSTAMGVVVLHKGKIVFERYPRMREFEKPIYWSVAKVMPATVLRIMEERGEVDVSKNIEEYIPDLAQSDFAGVTVRNILDMATGLDCQDEYEDRQSCYYQYSMAIGDGFREGGAPDNPYDFLKSLQVSKHAEQGTRFSYSGVNTFILAWLVEELTDRPFHDIFTEEIWQYVGAEADASYIAYRYGIPLTHGGFLSNMRDLARFGLLFTPSFNVVSDRQVISASHTEFIRSAGNPELLANAGARPVEESGIEHNIYQWDRIHANGTFYKGGWGGQGLLVNPEQDLVAVFTSYFKEDYSETELEPILFDVLERHFGDAADVQ